MTSQSWVFCDRKSRDGVPTSTLGIRIVWWLMRLRWAASWGSLSMTWSRKLKREGCRGCSGCVCLASYPPVLFCLLWCVRTKTACSRYCIQVLHIFAVPICSILPCSRYCIFFLYPNFCSSYCKKCSRTANRPNLQYRVKYCKMLFPYCKNKRQWRWCMLYCIPT